MGWLRQSEDETLVCRQESRLFQTPRHALRCLNVSRKEARACQTARAGVACGQHVLRSGAEWGLLR